MSRKLVKKKEQKKNTGLESMQVVLSYMTSLWAIVLGLALTLYMKDGYHGIGVAKYDAYAHVVVFGMPILLLLILGYVIICFRISKKEKRIQDNTKAGKLGGLSVTDWLVIMFAIVALVSYFNAGHLKTDFWGYKGWYMGIFSQISFAVIYFVYSRFATGYKPVLFVTCLAAFYAFYLSVANRLLIDPLGVYEGIADHYKNEFLSTMGQTSWFSSFLCIMLPIGMGVYWYTKSNLMRGLAGLFNFMGFLSLVSLNGDSGYFALVAFFMVLFHCSVLDAEKMKRFVEIVFMFAFSAKFMILLFHFYPNEILVLDQVSTILLKSNLMVYVMCACIIIWVVIFGCDKKQKYPVREMKLLRLIAWGAVIVAILAWISILVLGAKGKLDADKLGAVSDFLVWGSTWGNKRGFTWTITVKMFQDMGWINKIVGVGPDCYSIAVYELQGDLVSVFFKDLVLTNAHNEWLNMLINFGILGSLSYLGIFISQLVRGGRKIAEQPELVMIVMAVAAYMAHNFFCYQQVLCTPFIFLFMGMGEYIIRQKQKECA